MFVAARVMQALEERRSDFQRAALSSLEGRERYSEALQQLSELPREQIEQSLTRRVWPGARPTEEMYRRGPILPFETRWADAQAARTWALATLRGTTTVGVDGSQIAAAKEYGVPVSLAQVAWFENYHDPERPYVKDIRTEIVTLEADAREIEEYVLAESLLNRRRFSLEMEIAVERSLLLPADPVSLVMLDGSLVLSFICRMLPERRAEYVDALLDVLEVSRSRRVPVVGYIDRSFAMDLITMLSNLLDLPRGTVFDAEIVGTEMNYFDRTAAFECARGDVLPEYQRGERDHRHDICFVYLKTGQDTLPARLDFPRWILDAGLLDRVTDLVRAEIVVGSGYPYPIETADATSVLTIEDRQSFYSLYHDFATRNGLPASIPGKSRSKAHRR